MGWKSTRYVTRDKAIAFIREHVEELGDDSLALVLENLNDDPCTGHPLGVCSNFSIKQPSHEEDPDNDLD